MKFSQFMAIDLSVKFAGHGFTEALQILTRVPYRRDDLQQVQAFLEETLGQ